MVKKCLVLAGVMALLAACSTPVTLLVNPKTGQVARCGGNMEGSLGGGLIGYNIQKDNDAECVKQYQALGFTIKDSQSNSSNNGE